MSGRLRAVAALAALAALVGSLLALAGPLPSTATPPRSATATRSATVPAFVPDLLAGDDGLPASPALPPLTHGPVGIQLDGDGNAVDAHEGQYVAYFHGSYYLYGTAYGCGTHIDLNWDTPFCGFKEYRSTDLTHWRPVATLDSAGFRAACPGYCAFPEVLYSPRLHHYLLYFSADTAGPDGGGSRWIGESDSPVGPWRGLHRMPLEYGLSNQYSVVVGADGTAWMFEVECRCGGQPTDVYVERLNADRTATAGTRTTILHGVMVVGAKGFQYHGKWYLALVHNAHYFGPGALSYLTADGPAGPWTAPAGGTTPVDLTADGCGGTAQSVTVLPSKSGPVPVALVDLYRSSPGDVDSRLPDRAQHGDWNQALAGRYWAPLTVNADGTLDPISCTPSTRIPLAHPTVTTGGQAPVVAQPDGRITATGSIEQSFSVPTGGLHSLTVPVFQRAAVTDGFLPPATEPTGSVDAPLTVDLTTPAGTRTWTLQPSQVSWSPTGIALTLPVRLAAGTRATLSFRTTATTGCYGVLVVPATSHSGTYQAIEDGQPRPAPAARLLLTTHRD